MASEKARRAAFLGASIALISALAMGSFSCTNNAKQSQAAIEQSIQTELPVGSSYEMVEDYFVRNNIGHSFVERENKFYGLVPNVERNFLVTASVQILLTLDSQRRLAEVSVKTVYTGP